MILDRMREFNQTQNLILIRESKTRKVYIRLHDYGPDLIAFDNSINSTMEY